MDILLKLAVIAIVVAEVRDMVAAARDDGMPFGLRAGCIVADGVIMTVATRLLWPA